MTRTIAFASALLMLPILYTDYLNMQQTGHPLSFFQQIYNDPSEAIWIVVLAYPLCFITGHIAWLMCRVFNFVMHKLALRS